MFSFIRGFKSHVAYPLPFPLSTGGMAIVHDCAVLKKRDGNILLYLRLPYNAYSKTNKEQYVILHTSVFI